MATGEVREKVLEKAEALKRVLDERQGDLDDQRTVNIIEALVDLIETICPIPSRLVRDITGLLRSETARLSHTLPRVSAAGSSPNPTPSTSPEDHPSSSEVSLSSPDYSDGRTADNNDAMEVAIGAGQTQEAGSSNFPVSGSEFDAMLLQLQLQPDTTAAQAQGSAPRDFLDLFELLDQGFGSLPGFEATRGAGHQQDVAELPSSSGWAVDTHGGVDTTIQQGPFAFDTGMDTPDLLSIFDTVDTSSNHPLPALHPLSSDLHGADDDGENIGAQPWSQPLAGIDIFNELFFPPDIADTDTDRPLTPLCWPPPGCQEPLLSPAHSPLDMELDSFSDFDSEIASDNRQAGLDSSTPTAAGIAPAVSPMMTQALEDIRIAVENGDLQGLPFDQIPSTAMFEFPWGSLNGTTVRSLFRQFSCSGSKIGKDAIYYLSRKLTSSDVWIGQWPQRDQLPLCRRILFALNHNDNWSLIEAQPDVATITHYTSSQSLPDHELCSYCQDIITTVDRSQGRNTQSTSAWDFQVEAIATQSGCDGLWISWAICLRAKGENLLLPIPTDYHVSLVRSLVADLKAAYSRLVLLQTHPPMDRIVSTDKSTQGGEQLKDFWIKFGNDHGYGLRLWEKVQELATFPADRDRPTGQVRASELLQMALSIASPDSLLMVKKCIRQVRSELASEGHSFSESPRGLFEATRCHYERGDLSSVGSRIGLWKLQMLKSELKDELEAKILKDEPEHSEEEVRKQVQELLRLATKGGYWSHLVKHAGHGNPNILCLVPRAAKMGPFNRKFNTTSYRDLSVADCKRLGDLINKFRPGVIASIDANLLKVLLYVAEPLGCYPLEQLSENRIREQKLSSSLFCQALALTQCNSLS